MFVSGVVSFCFDDCAYNQNMAKEKLTMKYILRRKSYHLISLHLQCVSEAAGHDETLNRMVKRPKHSKREALAMKFCDSRSKEAGKYYGIFTYHLSNPNIQVNGTPCTKRKPVASINNRNASRPRFFLVSNAKLALF